MPGSSMLGRIGGAVGVADQRAASAAVRSVVSRLTNHPKAPHPANPGPARRRGTIELAAFALIVAAVLVLVVVGNASATILTAATGFVIRHLPGFPGTPLTTRPDTAQQEGSASLSVEESFGSRHSSGFHPFEVIHVPGRRS
ncbi:hypothetical protein [Nocardia sp. NPDC005745]|uniref:hypothetical protein n=1 Tax=Nocardia sp. NPDC005745 TaxID=3157061 RepID=UPI0033D8C167